MYQQSKGLVLTSHIHKEADKILVIYTYEWGKVIAVAPGAKKMKAKLSSATEPLVESDYMFYFTSLHAQPKITGAKIVDGYSLLLQDWRCNAIAHCCAEVCDKLTPLRAANPSKYELLARTWKLLETSANPWRIYIGFTLRFLRLTGYNFVEYLKKENQYITKEELALIRKLATSSGKDLDEQLDIDGHTEDRVIGRINNYLHYYLHRPLSARRFWQQIKYNEKKLVCT